ncbi:hypothetical protein [Apilactobacillus timberlakei]|uniref:hypothetical protein n=1 Tax=Apilactobacillus timberlakei TaxID=2008380 RepID=UPI00112BD693|nr:hypothetical protein [Apilactobacillus timberlakei]TPR16726.1 hypothetical protein DYZ95_07030 [Apilactobacillus timberlakei]TPR21588.1 hypothetical protein DY083_06080 [Apilactobacillus timberlakei]
MPTKRKAREHKDVLKHEQSQKSNIENALNFDTHDFMKKYSEMSNEERNYAEKLLELASEDPRAFVFGTMGSNGYITKNHGKSWDEEEKALNKNFNDKEKALGLPTRVTPRFDSKPDADYGLLGNLVFRASYSVTFFTLKTKLAGDDAIEKAKNDVKNIRKSKPKIKSEELKTATDEFKKSDEPSKVFDKDKKLSDMLSKTLGFKNVVMTFDNDKQMVDSINKNRKPQAPSYMNLKNITDNLNNEIKSYKSDPEHYFKNKELEKENKKEIDIVMGFVKGNIDDGELMTQKELDNDKEDINNLDKPYSIAFNDGLAKEYANRLEMETDLANNSPKDIHNEIVKDRSYAIKNFDNLKKKRERKEDADNDSKNKKKEYQSDISSIDPLYNDSEIKKSRKKGREI